MQEKKTDKLEWWEIPARGSVIILAILFFIPFHWYRAAYLFTIGRFFPHTVESRITEIGEGAEKRLALEKYPEKVKILVIKEDFVLELWGEYSSGEHKLIGTYRIFSASGSAGPKLREGDKQVPEGIYAIESLHPNSIFYLALKIDYPSEEDKKMAESDGRDPETLGSNIMLHGHGGSSGCIAVSDRTMEDIFYLTSKVGIENTRILIAPYDFRRKALPESTEPAWLLERYQKLDSEFKKMKQ